MCIRDRWYSFHAGCFSFRSCATPLASSRRGTLYILYFVLHSEINNRYVPHRGTSKASSNRRTLTKPLKHKYQMCMHPYVALHISRWFFGFGLAITTAYTAGPHFLRLWNNATNYGNNQKGTLTNQKGTLTNARYVTCALLHQPSTFMWLMSGIHNPFFLSLLSFRITRQKH